MSAGAGLAPLSAGRRGLLNRRSLHLGYATAGYNLLEGVVAVSAGVAASSSALLGFGLDSFIEVSSALVVIWQFRTALPEARERFALRLIALSFFALAGWITLEAARSLLTGAVAEASPVGIGIAAASVVVMPLLVWAKRRTGRELRSATVVADSAQTMLCTYLSGIVLAGLVLNSLLGWAWADPVAALVVAALALREGLEAWRGEQCQDCALPGSTGPQSGCEDDCAPEGAAGTTSPRRDRLRPRHGAGAAPGTGDAGLATQAARCEAPKPRRRRRQPNRRHRSAPGATRSTALLGGRQSVAYRLIDHLIGS